MAFEMFQNAEEEFLEDADRSDWPSFCGKYEHSADSDFIVDEVYMDDEELCAKLIVDGEEEECGLYPIGEKAFVRKGGFAKLVFGEDFIEVNGTKFKKL